MTTRTETGSKTASPIESRDDLLATFAKGEKPRRALVDRHRA